MQHIFPLNSQPACQVYSDAINQICNSVLAIYHPIFSEFVLHTKEVLFTYISEKLYPISHFKPNKTFNKIQWNSASFVTIRPHKSPSKFQCVGIVFGEDADVRVYCFHIGAFWVVSPGAGEQWACLLTPHMLPAVQHESTVTSEKGCI